MQVKLIGGPEMYHRDVMAVAKGDGQEGARGFQDGGYFSRLLI
jgi:hypothetical protein